MKKWIMLIFGLGLSTLVVIMILGFVSGKRVGRSQPAYYGGPTTTDVAQPEGFSSGISGRLGQVLQPDFSLPGRESSKEMIHPMPTVPSIYPGDDALDVDERVYKKSSRYDIVAKKVADYMQQMKEFVLSIDGRVLNSSMQSSGKVAYGHMFVKVPVEKFEETNGRVVSGADEVVNEQVTAEDETGKVVSLQDQLTELEDQLLERQLELEDETDEVKKRRLQVEIRRLEAQIEQLKERMEGVEATVEYASVVVRVANTIEYFDPTAERPTDLWEEVQQAWSSVLEILLVLARVVIWVVIYGILWLPIVLLFKAASHVLHKSREEKKES